MELTEMIKTNKGFIAKLNGNDSYKIVQYNKETKYFGILVLFLFKPIHNKS